MGSEYSKILDEYCMHGKQSWRGVLIIAVPEFKMHCRDKLIFEQILGKVTRESLI